MKIIAVMGVRNEADIIRYTLEHLIDNGIQVVVLDDESVDGTAEIINEYLGNGVLSVITRHSMYMDTLGKFKILHEEMLRYKPDWVFVVDADEVMLTDIEGETVNNGVVRVAKEGYDSINFVEFRMAMTKADDQEIQNPIDRMRYIGKVITNPNWRCYLCSLWPKGYEPHQRFQKHNQYPEPFIFKHYPYRSPEQIKLKLQDRNDRYMRDGMGGHYQQAEKESTPLSAEDLKNWDSLTYDRIMQFAKAGKVLGDEE